MKNKTLKPKINTDTLENGSVYMFANIKYDLQLYVNANGADQAMEKFDLCCFNHRNNWKIFMEIGCQPAESKGKK